ncbi:MAG: Calx-beta domain-containing protein, partial [Bacteroidota bacterium]
MTEYPNKLRNLYSASSWRRLCVALFLLLSCVQVQAQDIVVIGWNSDGGDDILFVTTTTISAGTEIYFTDNEWDDVLQAFNSGEGYITYTAPVGGLVAGEVVEILTPGTTGISATQGTAARTGGSFSLTGTGEALYAFTGSDVNTPSEIYFATNNAGGWGTNEEPTGAIAPNLTSVSLASGIDNAEYVGTRSVTSVTTEAPIVGNWTTTNGSGDQSITFDLTDFSATTSTSLNFSSASATVTESDGVLSTTVCVAISSPDATNATSIDVALTGGTASNGIDISTYSTTTLNFPAASSSNECVTITLTDDDWIEGVETLIFEIQNPTGVHSPVLGGVTTHTLTINDDNTGNANGGLFVNELSQGSLGNQEWIELVVTGDPSNPTDLVDLTGWIIDDHDGTAFTGVGGIESGYMFITGDCLNAVPPGSIIVIYREDDIDPTITTLGDDPTDSNKDGVYVFPGNHPCLLTCEPGAPPYTFPCATIDEVAPTFKGGVIFANGGDCGLTRRPDGTLFHALGYESTGTPAAVDPTNSIVFGTEGSNRSYRLECGSWNDATKYSIATGSSADVTPGAPNTSGNSIFINNIRNNTRDTNSDGVADASFDYTNLNDAAHCSGPVAFDYDGDGIIDENDLDDDNDGIPDMLEDAGTGFSPIADADMDGIPNFADTADVTIGFPTFV